MKQSFSAIVCVLCALAGVGCGYATKQEMEDTLEYAENLNGRTVNKFAAEGKRVDTLEGRVSKLEGDFGKLDSKVDGLATKVDGLGKLGSFKDELAALEARHGSRFTEIETLQRQQGVVIQQIRAVHLQAQLQGQDSVPRPEELASYRPGSQASSPEVPPPPEPQAPGSVAPAPLRPQVRFVVHTYNLQAGWMMIQDQQYNQWYCWRWVGNQPPVLNAYVFCTKHRCKRWMRCR